MSCAGAVSDDPDAFGAAATYYAKPNIAGEEAPRVELAVRLDPGSTVHCSTCTQAYAAELHSLALSLRIAAALRTAASEVLIAVNSPAIPARMRRLMLTPHRPTQCSSDASNINWSYFALRQLYRFPRIIATHEPGDATLCASRRADITAHMERPTSRDYPIGSEWCILEHNGERVLGQPSVHMKSTLEAQCSSAWKTKATQGHLVRSAPFPLPPSRRTALARSRVPPGIAKSAFQSMTKTHVTQHELTSSFTRQTAASSLIATQLHLTTRTTHCWSVPQLPLSELTS